MEGRSTNLNQTFILEQGERATKVRHEDNLKLEGSMSMQRQEAAVSKGERHATVRREDNLKMEGAFAGRVKDTSTARKMSNASTISKMSENRDRSNIVIGDDSSVASTSKAKAATSSTSRVVSSKRTAQESSMTAASSSAKVTSSKMSSQSTTAVSAEATTSAKSSTGLRANASAGLQGALVQTGQTAAADITAVNTDKFASSLRESGASAAIGQQKEISVIEHHRKQSMQKQSQDYRSSSMGYELSGHTGRTAAYGGRDYEYSSNLVGGGVGRRAESTSRTTIGQDYGARSLVSRQSVTSATAKQSFSSTFRQEASSSAAYQSTAQSSYRAQGQQVSKLLMHNNSISQSCPHSLNNVTLKMPCGMGRH